MPQNKDRDLKKDLVENLQSSSETETERLNRMLAAVIDYISDEEVEVIDIEYLLNTTEGLRDWWNEYREKNRKKIEQEIKKSLSKLSLEELEKIREQINV